MYVIIIVSQSHLLLLLLDLTISALDSQTLCPEKEGGGERERGKEKRGGREKEEERRGKEEEEREEKGKWGGRWIKGKEWGGRGMDGPGIHVEGERVKSPNPTHVYYDFINSLSWQFT